MAIQTSSIATGGNLTRYETKYRDAAMAERTYDILATPTQKTFEPNGTTIQLAWDTDLVPRPDTAVGNENTDFEPQTYRDATTTITLSYLNDGLKRHELAELKSSLNPDGSRNAAKVGKLAMQTIDALPRRKATEGAVVFYGDGSISARSSLDLGTAAHHLTLSNFTRIRSVFGSWQNDQRQLVAIIDDFQFEDLVNTSSSVITNRMAYTDKGEQQLFKYEMGMLAGIRLIVSPYTKAFYGAGAANASAVSTTVAASTTANIAGARTVEVAANTNIVAGMWLTIGTLQTSTESDTTIKTEIVYVNSTPAGTTVSITGKGPGGGLLYDHAVGETVKNPDTVHCAVFGHTESLLVAYERYGRYGQMVPPFEDGNARQWKTWSFKYFGGYGRYDETQLARVETSASGQ